MLRISPRASTVCACRELPEVPPAEAVAISENFDRVERLVYAPLFVIRCRSGRPRTLALVIASTALQSPISRMAGPISRICPSDLPAYGQLGENR